MYCEIDCDTLTCARCNKKTFDCKVLRNCIIDEPKIIIERNHKKEEKIHTHKVGTEIKKLLSKFGIKADSGCSCNDRAKHIDYMEQREPGWSEKNIDQIIDWMETEAKKRRILVFTRTAARLLIKLAIRNAKKQCVLCIQ